MSDSKQSTTGESFERLVEIMARLRAPDGCPWDREQTFDTIKPYTLEETYEVLEAIDQRDWDGLSEELGDLMLQCVFYAQMAEEEGHFSIANSLDAINRKLIRRHPHVFGDGDADTSDAVKKRWEEIKAEEQSEKRKPTDILAGVPRSQPALAEATQISSKVAAVGFDWENTEHVMDKLHEELDELTEARRDHPDGPGSALSSKTHPLEDELGDILFVVVNIARHIKVDPEQALRKANSKFRRRFGHVETRLREQAKSLSDSNLQEMEELWQEAKRAE
jgi:nucleoside triphosphate diphosphatase